MTSSLVGSEMCIRDRSQDGAQDSVSPRFAPFRALAWYGDGCGPHAPRACLLYTSDAADDM
eukprot:7475669-Prorocentrum_lima.AAC.1